MNKVMRITRSSNNPFLKNIFLIASGTAGGQFILFLAAPVLTRIYTPEDFGALAIYTSALSILVVIVALRYDLAILVAKDKKSSLELLIISLISIFVISSIVFLTLLFWGHQLLDIFHLNVPVTYFYLLPLSLVGLGIYETLSQVAIRRNQYPVIAKTKFIQSGVMGTAQIFYGLVLGRIGLLLGDVFGRVSGIYKMVSMFGKDDKHLMKQITIKSLLRNMKRYKNFPLFSSFSGLLNNGVLQLPPLILAVAYTQNVVGFFALTQRVVGVPMKMIGASIAQVYMGEIASLSRSNPKKIKELFLKISSRLFLAAIIPFFLMVFAAPMIFEVVFGSGWGMAGYYIQLLSPMYFTQFIVFPLSQTLEILEKQKTQLLWQFIKGIAAFGALVAPPMLGMEVKTTLFVYGITMTVIYLLFYLTILTCINDIGKSRL